MKLRMQESLGTALRSLHRRSAKLLTACCVAVVVLGTSGCVGVTSTKSNLVVTPDSVDFKGVAVGQKNTQTLQLSNVGSAALKVQQIQVTGAGFQVTPPALPLTLAPGAKQIFNLAFAPVATGSVSGTLTISSNDRHSLASVTVLGIGEKISSHTVTLSWNASSTASVIGYIVYRGTTSGGSYTRLTASLIGGLTFTDSGLLAGATYYYVITAMDATGVESGFSNPASVVMPNS